MDLAKIRQKARQDRDLVQSQTVSSEPVSTGETVSSRYMAPDGSFVSGTASAVYDESIRSEHVCQMNDIIPLPASNPVAQMEEMYTMPLPLPIRDPLEVILAGRVAAGCDEDLPLASTEAEEVYSDKYLEFLCFRVSGEYYGINIMDIKEIIKPRETTEVPRSPSFVSGVISLRGIIIPIIDMLDRLGLSREILTGRERVIVVKLKDALSGLLVDEIVQVVRIATDTLEPAPAVLDGIDRDFVSGIGRADGKMIIILNLETVADINLF